ARFLNDLSGKLLALVYSFSNTIEKDRVWYARWKPSTILKEMDRMDEQLPALKNFILPGGHPTVSHCHIARCVCRRAERMVVALKVNEPVDDLILQYLNRLSDYFFILARYLGQQLGAEEVIWQGR
ncbi:MAG: ATP:cob(I)alamin adenosyltransferase, partial [Bacteroidota bacterium]